MQAIMEPIFEIPYLIGAVLLGILMLRRADGRLQFKLFGVMAIVLGCGDAFHLIPRMWALISAGTTSLPEHAAALGFGKMVTSITMTVFYIMLYHIWQLRYEKTRSVKLTAAVYILGAARIILCLMPQNRWLETDSPLSWGIFRNIPFLILGIIIICLYFSEARRTDDRIFKNMWLAISLSFAFYVPVVLFADAVPIIGTLMIPKTCAYVWILIMGFKASRPLKNK